MRKASFAKFINNTEGSIAILTAGMMLAIVGAAGIGVDTYIAQSQESALKHIVDLSCSRTEDTDIAVAPDVSSVNGLTKTFANNLKNGTFAKDSVISISDPVDGTSLSEATTITATDTFTPTLTAILGAKPFTITKSATCSRRTIVGETPNPPPPPKQNCNVVLTYLDTKRTNRVLVGDLSKYAIVANVGGGAINYIYTVVDNDKKITTRKFFSSDLQIDPKDLKNNGKDQTMYVQVMNSDGSIPNLQKQCIVTSSTETPVLVVTDPPPPTPPCDPDTLGGYADLLYAAGDMSGRITENGDWKTTSFADYTITPAVKDVVKGETSVIVVKRISTGDELQVPITANFSKLNPLDIDVIAATAELTKASGQNKNTDPESAFLVALLANTDATLNQSPGQVYNHEGIGYYINQKYRLDRIISVASGVWQLPDDKVGLCPASVSPIVIDLTNKGSIATTGTSTAQKAVRASVGKTISFDMLGNGTPLKMEWIIGNGQGFLIDNRDGNAEKDMNGKRLFGNTAQHANGYAKLAVSFSPDKNGVLTGDSLKGLAIWVDNGDGIVQSGEIKSLSDLGITEISTRIQPVKDSHGDLLMRSYVIRYNMKIMSEDVWFGVEK